MKKLLTLYLLLFVCSAMAQESDTEVKVSTPGKINWLTINEALDLNKTEPKIIFIDFYTSWCGWCKRMDKTTFEDSLIISTMNEGFYAVKFDAEGKEDVIVEGTTFSYVDAGRRGHHELAAQILGGKMSYPTFSFLENQQVLTNVAGYQPREGMLKILEFFIQYKEDKSLTWEDFSENYTSPYPPENEEE